MAAWAARVARFPESSEFVNSQLAMRRKVMSHPNTLAARTRRSLMALAVGAVLLVVAAFVN
jgi:hypothetical protein